MVVYGKVQLRLIERRLVAQHLGICGLRFCLGGSYRVGSTCAFLISALAC